MDETEFLRAVRTIVMRHAGEGAQRAPGDPGPDFRVESVELARDPDGLELEVWFRYRVTPELVGRVHDNRWVVRLPFLDQEWRARNGYATPEEYAAEAMREVAAAREDVLLHHRARLSLESGEDLGVDNWPLLMAELGETAREVAPGRVEVDWDGRVVTFLITHRQWEELVAPFVGLDLGDHVGETLGSLMLDDDEVFVVVHGDRLVGSMREELPPVRGRALERRLAAMRAANPDASIGWYAYPPNGEPTDQS